MTRYEFFEVPKIGFDSICMLYAHVYVEEGGRWRMVSAQGTPIAAE